MRSLRRRLLWAAAMLMGAAVPANAWCSISVSPLTFGHYDVFDSGPSDSIGQMDLFCSVERNVSVTIEKGSSGTFNSRALQNGPERLSYNLFRDAARTTVWGDGSEGTSALIIPVVRPNDDPIPVYGRIPPGQDVGTGAYSDTVTVVVNF